MNAKPNDSVIKTVNAATYGSVRIGETSFDM